MATHVSAALVDRSSSVATGGTAVSIAASLSRRYLFIKNPATTAQQGVTAESLWISLVGTAAANGASSLELTAGSSYCIESGYVATNAVSINAATSGHKFIAWEG